MTTEILKVGDVVEPRKGVFMPDWSPGAYIVKIGMPEGRENEQPKQQGGDWVILSCDGGWLPRHKFRKIERA